MQNAAVRLLSAQISKSSFIFHTTAVSSFRKPFLQQPLCICSDNDFHNNKVEKLVFIGSVLSHLRCHTTKTAKSSWTNLVLLRRFSGIWYKQTGSQWLKNIKLLYIHFQMSVCVPKTFWLPKSSFMFKLSVKILLQMKFNCD